MRKSGSICGRAGAVLVFLAASLPPVAMAEETIDLGDGASVTILDYVMETLGDGSAPTLIVKTKPNFDPEPYGQVPSDEYARVMQPLCANLLANSREALEREKIGAVRVRWDFNPTYDTKAPENVTISRFHEAQFEIGDNWRCVPHPLGVGYTNVAPKLPTGLPVTLRYAETGPVPRRLTLTYAVGEPLGEVTMEKLENAAIELCILHADLLLESRDKWYQQQMFDTVSIGFHEEVKPGMELERRVVFGLRDGRCDTGLSAPLVEGIRANAG
jgi:hypothetical protein